MAAEPAQIPEEEDSWSYDDAGVLTWNGDRFRLVGNATEQMLESLGLSTICRDPGDDYPRPVMGALVWGRRVFWPLEQFKDASLPYETGDSAAKHVLAEDRRQQRMTSLRASSIPRDLETEVVARARNGESLRSIAEWLLREKDCQTSYGSVSRLVRRVLRSEAQAAFAAQRLPALLEDLDALRSDFNDLTEKITTLVDEAFDQHARGEDVPIPPAFQMARQAAHLIDRRLRETTRDYVALMPANSDSDSARVRGCTGPASPFTPSVAVCEKGVSEQKTAPETAAREPGQPKPEFEDPFHSLSHGELTKIADPGGRHWLEDTPDHYPDRLLAQKGATP